MIPRQPRELVNHMLDVITYSGIAGNQIRIAVGKRGPTAFEQAARVQVEEDCAAAKERLPVVVELAGVIAAQQRQQLSLATRPLQKRPGHVSGGGLRQV